MSNEQRRERRDERREEQRRKERAAKKIKLRDEKETKKQRGEM